MPVLLVLDKLHIGVAQTSSKSVKPMVGAKEITVSIEDSEPPSSEGKIVLWNLLRSVTTKKIS